MWFKISGDKMRNLIVICIVLCLYLITADQVYQVHLCCFRYQIYLCWKRCRKF